MKRTTAILFGVLLCLLMLPMISFADISVDWDIEELHDGYALQPGRVYYFPIMNGGYQVEQGESTGFTYRPSVEPTRGTGVTASVVTENKLQWLKVSVSGTAGRDEDYVEIILNITDRTDRDYKYEDSSSFEIGYGDAYYVSEDEVEIYDDQSVIEFSDSVNTCYVYLPEGSEFIANLLPNSSRNKTDGINRIIDFYSTSDMIYDIETRYGGTAVLEYLRFYTGATFGQSLLRFYAPSMNYVYAVDGSNNLSRLTATRNGDFLVITTTTLGNYVLSDRDLGVGYGASTGTGASSIPPPGSYPQAPSPMPSSGYSYPPATGGSSGYKSNPATGACA